MSTLMSQVTCSLCNMKINELKWNEHIVSSKHLEKCKENHNELTTKFFKMFFDIGPQREEIFNLKNEKTHDFWQSYFSPKLPKEKFDGLCNGSIDKVEIEDSLSKDFKEFIPEITPFIGRNYYDSMKITTFCRICGIEINKVLLYEHCISKEHKENEDYLIVMGMTYCDLCNKEIRNDEWRKHIFSENQMNRELKVYCKVCNMKYLKFPSSSRSDEFYRSLYRVDTHHDHNNSDTHVQNHLKSKLHSS